MQTLWLDVRYALRLFRRSPGFVAIAVLSLALGAGANSAIFSLMNALTWRELPIREPNRLAHVGVRTDGRQTGLSYSAYQAIVERQRVFSSMLAWSGDGIFNVEAQGALTRGDIWAVTGNFHDELGVTPSAGRLLRPDDVRLDTLAPTRVAVVGYGFWQRHLGADPQAVGQTIRVEGEPFTIVGIGPEGFTALGLVSEPDVTIPLTAFPLLTKSQTTFTMRRSPWLDVGGRLRDGVTLEQARAQLESIWPAVLAAAAPPDFVGAQRESFFASEIETTSLAHGQDLFLRRQFTGPLRIVLAVAGLVLLIACVNLASLMLSRMSLRAPEMALRGALGASRARLIRQVTTEGLLLSLAGGGLGLLFAWWTSGALSSLMTADYLVPSRLTVTPDWRVLTFTTALAFVSGVVVSVAPAWRATRRDLAAGVPQGTRTSAGTGRVSRSLVIGQTALSVVILMDAVLLVGTLRHLRSIDSGLRADQVMLARLYNRPDGYKDIADDTYYPQLVARVAALPGVHAVGLSAYAPATGRNHSQPVTHAGASPGGAATSAVAPVSPGLLDVLGVRLVEGRDLRWSDDSRAARVTLVSASLARHLFPQGGAIGRRIDVGHDAKRQNLEIVGIVSDARFYDVREPNVWAVYLPVLQHQAHWGVLAIRTAQGASIAASLRTAVESLGREHVINLRSIEQTTNRALLQPRVTALLAAFFGGLTLTLAVIGLCGLMLYTVTQRTREIGVRLAIGAARADVVALILRETLTLVVAGVAIGVPAALASGRLVASLVVGLTPSDPAMLALVVIVLLLGGALAGFVPAYRASRIDPMDALRS
jgi:predicted permease